MIDLPPLELTMEQQFELKKAEAQIRQMSSDQAQELLLELMRQLMIKDNVLKHLIKQI